MNRSGKPQDRPQQMFNPLVWFALTLPNAEIFDQP